MERVIFMSRRKVIFFQIKQTALEFNLSLLCRYQRMHRFCLPIFITHVLFNGRNGSQYRTGPAMHNKQNRRGRVGRERQSAFKAEVHLALGTVSMKPTVSTSLAAGIANKMLSTFL
jgi:hypothetical protein